MESSHEDGHANQAQHQGEHTLERELAEYADRLRVLSAEKGAESVDVYAFKSNFASMLSQKGHLEVAIALLEDLVRDSGAYEVDPESKLVTRGNLAYLYELKHMPVEAAHAYEGLYRDCLRQYGADHDVTRQSKERFDKYRGGSGE